MKRIPNTLMLVLALMGSAPALGADITFYEREGFRGRSFVANQTIPNFANVGFNDRASSVVIRTGQWELCSDADFRGRCVSVSPGEYPDLRALRLDNRISSARNLDQIAGRPAGNYAGHLDLYDGVGFGGRNFDVNGTISNLGAVGFNNRTRSMIVHEGTWEACERPDFEGTCVTFRPGRYPALADFGERISSLRQVAPQ